MNNEPPALMLDLSCCYGKHGIILEWPYYELPLLQDNTAEDIVGNKDGIGPDQGW